MIATLAELTWGKPAPRGEDGLTDVERAAMGLTS